MKLNSLSDLAALIPNGDRIAGSVKKDPETPRHNGKGQVVRILLDAKGRKGKVVTIITGLHHNPATIKELARILKQYCGAGGSVKDGVIEVQGDQRSRVGEKMRELGYNVAT